MITGVEYVNVSNTKISSTSQYWNGTKLSYKIEIGNGSDLHVNGREREYENQPRRW